MQTETLFSSTIAAVSTPRGKGGVALIRISGEEAAAVAGRCFFPKCKKSVENLFLRIPRLGKILGQNPGVSVVPDAADQIDRGVVAGKAGCLDIEKEQIGDSS